MQILAIVLIITAAFLGMSAVQWQFLEVQWMSTKLFSSSYIGDQKRNDLSQMYHFYGIKRPAWMESENLKSKEKVSGEPQEKEHSPIFHLSKYVVPTTARMPVNQKLFNDPKNLSFWQERWITLFNDLYGSQDFYLEFLTHNPKGPIELIGEVLKEIERLKEENPNVPETSYSLSLVDLSNPLHQSIWYKMLKGSDREEKCYPSLIRYFYFSDLFSSKETGQISITYAPFPVLRAFLGEQLARDFIQQRNKVLQPYREDVSLEEARLIVLKKSEQDKLLEDAFKKEQLKIEEFSKWMDKRIYFNKMPVESVLELSDLESKSAWVLLGK